MFITDADDSCGGRVFSVVYVCASVYLFAFMHNI